MLRDRLLELTKNLDVSEELLNSFHEQVIKYYLGISSEKKFNRSAKNISHLFMKEAIVFRIDFMHYTEYMASKFWKAVVGVLRTDKCYSCKAFSNCEAVMKINKKSNACNGHITDEQRVAAQFGVDYQDLMFAMGFLSESDKRKVLKRYEDRDILYSANLDFLFLEVRKYSMKLINHKCKFLLASPHYDFETLVGNLMIDAVARAKECDTIKDKELLKNTVFNKVKQSLANLLNHIQRDKRAVIYRDEEDYIAQIHSMAKIYDLSHLKIEDLEQRFKKQLKPKYIHRLSSIDDLEGENQHSHYLIKEDCHVEERMIKEVSKREVLADINEKYRPMVKTILGKDNKGFNNYLKAVKTDDSKETQVVEAMYAYFGINKNDFVHNNKKIFAKHLL